MHSKLKTYPTTTLKVIIVLMAIALSPAAAETEEARKYETGFYYTIQKGDTLWDLSQKFSDTPNAINLTDIPRLFCFSGFPV